MVRVLCCEGKCSNAYRVREQVRRVYLRGLGYTDAQARMQESAGLRHTSHVKVYEEIKGEGGGDVILHYWRCLVCGHERVYGVEDPVLVAAISRGQ